MNIWLPHHTMLVSPAETVDTVNVSTSNFDAEQGMAGGAAITVITKSGTNKFKGSAFAFYNNENLNAKPYFATVKKPASAHIDGATLGGPIMKNKLFFFGAWEGQYQKTPQQFFYNVPPTALRVGDFSQAFNPDGSLQVIYDPMTGNPDGTGRVPFPGNVIPADLIEPIAKQIQALYPLPNATGEYVGRQRRRRRVSSRNYVRSLPRKFDRNNYDFKVNWNLSSAAQVWGKYSRMGANVDVAAGLPGRTTTAVNGDTTVNMYTFGTTWTINSDDGLRRHRRHLEDDPRDAWPATSASATTGWTTLGIPGMNGGANFSSDPRYAGIPLFVTLLCIRHIGNADGWDPGRARRAHLRVCRQPHEAPGRPRVPGRVLAQSSCGWTTGSRSSGTGRAAELDGATNATAPQRRHADGQLLQRVRGVPARPRSDARRQERPERADDHARVAARHLRARSVAGQHAG